LAPQFVGDYRRLSRYRRNDRYAYTAALDCLDEVAEGSVAREQNRLVELIGELADLGCPRASAIALGRRVRN
jgi:hypothetical protein